MATQYVIVHKTATTTPASEPFNVKDITYIANHDVTNWLYVSFENNVTEDYIPIPPNGTLDTFPESITPKKIWYKTTTGTALFSAFGDKT